MPRGRRSQPDEIKRARGNPGKRKLPPAPAETAKADRVPLEVPEFLVGERERAIYVKVVEEYLQRRIAKATDVMAYARWAHYLDRWITCKETLHGKATFFKSTSVHGELLRRHPVFKDQLDLERLLQSLEDRLGLNPVARQNIIRGLAALPPALGGGLFGGDGAADDGKPTAGDEPNAPGPPEAPENPIGALASSTKH